MLLSVQRAPSCIRLRMSPEEQASPQPTHLLGGPVKALPERESRLPFDKCWILELCTLLQVQTSRWGSFPIATPGIYYGPVNSNILGEGYKEVIEPTIKETFLSPLDGDTITLTDTDGSSAVFTFKYGLNLGGLANNEVQIPINRYDRIFLDRKFT